MTEERPKLSRCISTLAIDHVDTPKTPQQNQDQKAITCCPHHPDIPLEADFELCVVDTTNEAIANVKKKFAQVDRRCSQHFYWYSDQTFSGHVRLSQANS